MTNQLTLFDVKAPEAEPLVVSYGGGVDSTAMLVGLWSKGIKPAAILFADTGAEFPSTYRTVWQMTEWLLAHDMPAVTIVRYQPVRAPYSTLEEKCLANETLPSLAYGKHSCSLVFKVEPQQRWLRQFAPAKTAWAVGQRVRVAVGYDAGTRDRERSAKRYAAAKDDAKFAYWYPLQEWGWTREHCIQVIEAAGAPAAVKSSCFFCPAMKKPEIQALQRDYPELFERALAVEARALTGKHDHTSTKGLGRRFAWADVREAA